ncbi:hypothetical protein Lacal_1651 [Lacinutrix sp. 5H-3-7-4]|nr:hypothetical protein Lacal_1651 [Lacinutrix sp. 5H-3-7-4]
MNTNQILTTLIIVFVIYFIFVNIKIVIKIKQSREAGIKLYKKNWYYKFLSRYFIKNLPS